MGQRRYLGRDVFSSAVERIAELYRLGHRVIVAFSAGKDSGVCLELAILAAKQEGKLPVEVVMRDEEIMYPGTYEYAERVAARPEVDFHWIIMRQPIINIFNRDQPYWWVFDDQLKPEDWVRQPPDFAEWITADINLTRMIHPNRFPPAQGKELFTLVGVRGQESKARLLGIHSMKGYLGGDRIKYGKSIGQRTAWPIYDWTDGDVWRAVSENKWDYNSAYDVMFKMGIPKRLQRIGPPTMTFWGTESLKVAAAAWPRWFDKVCERCPGTRQVTYYGMRAVLPIRRDGESWKDCFYRECIEKAPDWIAERATLASNQLLNLHAKHSAKPFPEITPCPQCSGAGIGSWKELSNHLYNGDPFKLKVTILPLIQPSFFRSSDKRDWGDAPPTFS